MAVAEIFAISAMYSLPGKFILSERSERPKKRFHWRKKNLLSLKAFIGEATAARHDGLMHAAKSMKNGSEWAF